MGHINIEIKARCSDHERIRSILQSKNAEFKGLDHQIDTYFKVNSGRLKLREGNIENHLIFYDRVDQEGPKQSNVTLFKTELNSEIKSILTKALGVLYVVDKAREVYFIDNVKFHLDTVKDLGTFMEIEAIDTGGIPKEKLTEQCKNYMQLFEIKDSDLLSVSYSDLLLAKSKLEVN
ncbi:MAG: class IV adenylate cyclase [Candidatus Marsarchaeota archaeon]|nr:class IV adenylate cyclase [Candidatus Marsarchaeota archaeon]